MLNKDHRDDPNNLRILYFLGVTTFALLETRLGNGVHAATPDLLAIIESGMNHLKRSHLYVYYFFYQGTTA